MALVQRVFCRNVFVLGARCLGTSSSKIALSSGSKQALLATKSREVFAQQVRFDATRRIWAPFPKDTPKPTKKQVDERVLKAIQTFDRLPKDKPLTMDSHFLNDLGLDSLDHVELVMAVETEFGVEIPDEDAEKLMTPKQIVEYICTKEEIAMA